MSVMRITKKEVERTADGLVTQVSDCEGLAEQVRTIVNKKQNQGAAQHLLNTNMLAGGVTTGQLIACVCVCARMTGELIDVLDCQGDYTQAVNLIGQVNEELKVVASLFTDLNQLVSDKMVSVTAHVSTTEREVTDSTQAVHQKQEELKKCHVSYMEARLACIKYQKTLKDAKAEAERAQGDRGTSAGIRAAPLVAGLVPGLGVFGILAAKAVSSIFLPDDQHLKSTAENAVEHFEATTETYIKYTQEADDCEAKYKAAREDMFKEQIHCAFSETSLGSLRMCQKIVLSAGEEIKKAHVLIGKLAGQAEVAQFMAEDGATARELLIVLENMKHNFEQLQQQFPALKS